MTLDELDAIRAAMTPGEWSESEYPWSIIDDNGDEVAQVMLGDANHSGNRRGIVALHNAYPALLDRLRQAEELLRPLAEAVTAEPMVCAAVSPSHCRKIAAFLADRS